MVEVRNLMKRFGEITAVDDLSFTVEKGKVLGFLGPNGAGKSTTINMLCGLLKPDRGEVLFNGSREKSLKDRLGLCPQEIVIWPKLTCFEQLVFSGEMYNMKSREARKSAEQLLSDLDLRQKRNKRASTLSGGMQRRLNIALALVHDPEIIVLDEPEAGLDPQSRVMVRDFIKNISSKKTIIFTTHNMDEADRVSDKVVIIDRGKALRNGTPQGLKNSIGSGDVLEIGIRKREHYNQEGILQQVGNLGISIRIEEETLNLKALDIIRRIPEISGIISESGAEITGMQLRENTLEDVFIHLTGRTLRQ